MTRLRAALLGVAPTIAVMTITVAAAADGPFQGEWRTTIGIVKLEQNGNEVTGKYGANGRFPLNGTVQGKTLTFEYQEGQAKGSGEYTLDESGNAFTGKFQVRGGRGGQWNGWRPDPHAKTDKAVTLNGLWLTELGLMELTQNGDEVKGRVARRGTSTLDGKAIGRRLDFRFMIFQSGHGWFDFTADGKSFSGAANTDGYFPWFGWKGRRAQEFVQHVPLKAGELLEGSTKGLLTYTVRAPEGYQSGSTKKWPAILILHGSNMNGRAYVNTLAAAWPDVARDYIVLGINGETPSHLGDEPRFNYTYVNYMGRSTYKGFPGTDRESPALVSEAMSELKEVYPIAHYFVGGHSQGGYLTYSLLMNFPGSMAGAFPISAEVIMQCQPDVYAELPLRQAQRRVPLAIIHGKNDPMVGFAGAQYAATLFGDASWPAFRFFVDDHAAHMFGRLPVGPAIRWLEALSSNEPKVLLDFAQKRLGEGGYRDAIAALRKARELKLDSGQRRTSDQIARGISAKAAPGAAKYLKLIRESKDGSWIDGFLAYRDQFEFADDAREAMAAFDELRSKQEEPAKTAFGEARQLFSQGKENEGYAKYQLIVQSYYASPLYRNAKRWLEERK
jgi:predicted esterase